MASHFNSVLFKRGSLAEFNAADPILASGEPAFAIDTNTLKIGNGVDSWANLNSFISTYDLKKAIVNVAIPSIAINQAVTLIVNFDGVNLNDKYAVFTSPESSLPDGIVISYSYVSDTDEVSIVLRNTSLDYIDGGNSNNSGSAQASQAISDVNLYVLAYLVLGTTTTTTTTTTAEPMVDNIQSFGYNEFGQLGTNDNFQHNEPTPVADHRLWQSFSAGHYHSLAVDSEDDLYSFGYNYYGQLGLGTSGPGNNKKLPNKSSISYISNYVYSSGSKWNKVAAGTYHSLAIDSGNKLFAFGSNAYGSLGVGDTNLRSYPTMVGDNITYSPLSSNDPNEISIVNDLFTFIDINANVSGDIKYLIPSGSYIISGVPEENAIAVLNSGLSSYITYSGENFAGSSVLTGTTSDGLYNFYYGNVYINVSGDFGSVSVHSESGGYMGGENLLYYSDPNAGWQEISAGQHHSLGIKNGELYAFGQNSFGQLGTGDNEHKLTPVKIGSKTDWVKVAAGNYHSLAIDSSGSLWSFGNNNHGQLGLGNTNNRNIPTKISGVWQVLEDFTFVNLQSSGAIGIDQDDAKYVLNYEQNKQYTYQDKYLLTDGAYVISGVTSGCPIAVLNDGKQDYISYSGTNYFGSRTVTNTTNNGTYNFYYGTLTINVSGDFEKLSFYTYGSGYMGGENIFYYDRGANTWSEVSAGNEFSLAIDTTNKMWSFGKNDHGQLGLGDTTPRNIPAKVAIENWQRVDAGASHSLAINTAKRLWSFGSNVNGQLGLGDTVDRYDPTIVSTDIRWAKPVAGGNHSLVSIYSYYPTAPTNVIVKNASTSTIAGSKELEVSWNHNSIYEEGITNFKIQCSGTNISPFFVTKPISTDTYNIVGNLINGSGYQFRVASVNNIGEVYSDWTSPAIQPSEVTDNNFCSTVKLLSHFDGSGNSTTFTDLSKNAWSGSGIGSAKITTNHYKFGYSSAILDNAGAITFGSGNELNLSGNFTVECFVKPSCWNSLDQVILNGNQYIPNNISASGWVISANNGTIAVKHNVGGSKTTILTSNINIPLNEWSHIAWARSGTTNSLFINGTKRATDSIINPSPTYNDTVISVGAIVSGQNLTTPFWGYIDEVRLSSTIRYSGVYTIPVRSFGINTCS